MICSVLFRCFFLFYFFVIFYFNFTEENITYAFLPIFPHLLTCVSSHGVFYSFYQEFYHFTNSSFTIWFVVLSYKDWFQFIAVIIEWKRDIWDACFCNNLH